MKKISFILSLLILAGIIAYMMLPQVGAKITARLFPGLFPEDLLPEEVIVPKKIHLTAIGDSLTQGVGDSNNEGGYLRYLADDLEKLETVKDVKVDNLGIKGYRTTQLLEYLQEKDVKEKVEKADVVLITIGGNDLMQIVKNHIFELQMDLFAGELVHYKKRLDDILAQIRAYNKDTAIVLVGLYNPFSEWFGDIEEMQQVLDDWNSASETVVSEYENTYFVPISEIFSDPDKNLLYDDQFHPNDEGYKRIAGEVFLTLKQHLEPSRGEEYAKEEER